MPIGIGIDVYGTLIDPLGMISQLRPLTGAMAETIAQLWRAKQLEYTFRRAVMGTYENFDVCTQQALTFVLESIGISLDANTQDSLVDGYQRLQAYPDTLAGLRKLQEAGCAPVAFSNGVETTLHRLLGHAGLLNYLRGVVSVDNLRTYKPDPRVYRYLVQRLGRAPGETWLVSSNSFDVIGAKAAGLRAAWIRRNADSRLDPWGIQPDIVAPDLLEFAGQVSAFR